MRSFIPIAFLLTACGQHITPTSLTASAPNVQSDLASCSTSPYLGTWNQVGTTETLTIRSDCSGYSTYCNANLSFGSLASGVVAIYAQSSNGNLGCPIGGNNSCSLTPNGNGFTVNCPGTGGTLTFSH